jgi:mannan endo-1,4-beta-mannosidase
VSNHLIKILLLCIVFVFVVFCSFGVDHAYIAYKCVGSSSNVGSISPMIQIYNDGTTNIRLADLEVRYWYTIDSVSDQTFYCDSAPFGTSNVYGAFTPLALPVTGADYYCRITFPMAAGVLGPGDSSGDIQIRFNKNDWSNYIQTNDYSFDATMVAYTVQPKITIYLKGSLLFGTDLVTGVTAPALSILPPGSISVDIDTNSEQSAISPYIYGANQMWSTFNTETETFWTARRFGGNRATAYNWENNSSNAGKEDNNKSDDFWGQALNVPTDQMNVPAIAITKYHDKNLSYGWYSLLTLQMAGYVAKDKNGTVASSEVAPSTRWDSVAFTKGSAFSYPPSLTDNSVYIDELLDYLVKKYGSASGGSGIKGYALDNEPGLWSESHPLMHPNKVTCDELIKKSIDCAKVVKKADPQADVFGPAFYGLNDYMSLQDAPDWAATYAASYTWFLDLYLDKFKAASATEGKRLLDVLDIHWYPEAKGGGKRITFDAFDANNVYCNKARVQAPRSLWDPFFTENSWISQWHPEFLPLLPRIKTSINTYYPGTKLAITEYNYGGDPHITGGIAQADFLGVIGKLGVYYATYWAVHSPQNYASSAFRLYRDYDGSGSKYGNTSVKAALTDNENGSVFASISGTDDSSLHVIAINKNFDYSADFTFRIYSGRNYISARAWAFDSSSSSITERNSVPSITNNTFTYSIPKLSVFHFVITAGSGTGLTPEPPAATPVPTPVDTPQMTPAPTATSITGDVNNDGTINIVDALLIAQYYVGLNPVSFSTASADVSKDGIVDIRDALLIAQCFLGIRSCSF